MRSTLKVISIALLASPLLAKAEDIDLFVQELDAAVRSNVIFVMDNSGSMRAIAGTRSGRTFTRMTAAKDSMTRFISTAENINLGLMSFNANRQGGKVDLAAQPIEDKRTQALQIVAGYQPNVIATPMVETLYEAFRYLRGYQPYYGGSSSTSEALSGGRYKSPVVNECQKSNIIYFTDGYPWRDGNANRLVRGLLSGRAMPSSLNRYCNGGESTSADSCFDEMAWYLYNTDMRSDLSGNQNIKIFTIAGFGSAPDALMRSAAQNGGGAFYSALDDVQLDNALADIMVKIRASATTFTSPGTSTNAFNALETSDDVYYALFKPIDGNRWKGNLKRYRLGDDNQIYDADGQLAIDPDTGFFKDTARSFWSSSKDGGTVEAGGMAENRSQNAPAFTNLGGDTNQVLSTTQNRFHESNWGITQEKLGVLSSNNRDTIIRWARGVDVDDENTNGSTTDDRDTVGDPLHTQPQAISYFPNDKTVYFSTNDGFLYAVNADDGTTEFSFIPDDLLDNLARYRGIEDNTWSISETFTVTGSSSYTTRMYFRRVLQAEFALGSGSQTMEVSSGRYDILESLGQLIQRQVNVTNGGKTLQVSTDGVNWGEYELTVTHGFFTNFGTRVQYVIPEPRDEQNKIYGLDGPITAWVNDANDNGQILRSNNGTPEPGEHVYLYLTMRRGGTNVYALDVTDRTNPKLKWVLRGNTNNGGSTDRDFGLLGQTWSAVKMAKVKWKGSDRNVLLFGGGYDPSIDFAGVDSSVGKNLLLPSWQTDNATEAIEALPASTYGSGLGSDIALEMEADSEDTGNIYQYINASHGDIVRITFDYSARDSDPGIGSTLYVYFGNQWLDVLSRPAHGWFRYTYDVVVDQHNPRLEFHAQDPRGNNSQGGIINSQTISAVKIASASSQSSSLAGGSSLPPSGMGNAVFMVDAETGALLWRASDSGSNLNIGNMRYSIPADLTLADIDQDGLTDYFFAADTGGQIIRFDINEANSGASNFARGGVIASISQPSATEARRFFQSPDVSVSSTAEYLNIAVGTGLRHSPLDTSVDDRMYVFRDPHIYEPPTSYNYDNGSVITESSLYDATSNVLQEGSSTQKKAALKNLNNRNGWFIRLEEPGEKILSNVKTFGGLLLFNSFAVNTSSSSACSSNPGLNYFYALDIENAGSLLNFDNPGNAGSLNKSNRKTQLKHSSLAPDPSIISRGNKSEVCVGTECFQDTLKDIGLIPVSRQYWRERR
ncbi:pilus assembly protein [Endozoicomonas sp. SCSIO W0465]|uniref:pilus assembly protein n=1 Tax=Endozoicomonas sp. SCSIO W0465 TaxID=2918516 RepID=UPI0020755F0F|nr:VWA domain-containing protein [Endozoicomonas sp. SCSIO W0465]USE37537.1 VWA domain-containing protein [Endozoicomonas sp. SCSIO W0465]